MEESGTLFFFFARYYLWSDFDDRFLRFADSNFSVVMLQYSQRRRHALF